MPYKQGRMDMKGGFDFGSEPGCAVERAVEAMNDLVEEGKLDEATLAPLVFWLAQHELGWSDPPPGWTQESDSAIVCSTRSLALLIDAIEKLERHVAPSDRAGWDRLAKLCGDAARSGGTIAIYYDPEG